MEDSWTFRAQQRGGEREGQSETGGTGYEGAGWLPIDGGKNTSGNYPGVRTYGCKRHANGQAGAGMEATGDFKGPGRGARTYY